MSGEGKDCLEAHIKALNGGNTMSKPRRLVKYLKSM